MERTFTENPNSGSAGAGIQAEPQPVIKTSIDKGHVDNKKSAIEEVGDRKADTGLSIHTTLPDKLLRHSISDEQLEMFMTESKDGLSETFWGLVGAACAALPSSLEALYNSYYADNAVSLSILHLVEIIITVVAVTCAVLIKLVYRRRSMRTDNLVNKIRSQKAT
jgi:hypothetical protein